MYISSPTASKNLVISDTDSEFESRPQKKRKQLPKRVVTTGSDSESAPNTHSSKF